MIMITVIIKIIIIIVIIIIIITTKIIIAIIIIIIIPAVLKYRLSVRRGIAVSHGQVGFFSLGWQLS